MSDIEFLGLEDIFEIHRDQIRSYGGSAEIRDISLLKSAIAMPQASFETHYLHEDIFLMAAAYLFHITQDHPFVDGNKRTGAVAAIVFLALNGIEIESSEDDLENLVRNVATGYADKAIIAEFFRQHRSN